MLKNILCVVISFSLTSSPIIACSSFFVQGSTKSVLAKSYDWDMEHGLIVVNKRGVAKTSINIKQSDIKTNWVSQYGSVTFNQYGVELPNGGLNEAGLAVEILWLNGSVFPAPDGRTSLNESQWIQFQLDNFSSTDEVLENLEKTRISSVYGAVHYLVCDKTKHCSVIEFISGATVVTDYVKAITNNTSTKSLNHLANFKGYGGEREMPEDYSSLSRFVRSRTYIDQFQSSGSNKSVEYAFKVLKSLEVKGKLGQGRNISVWQIAYDFEESKIHFQTTSIGVQKTLNMNQLDFSCKTPRKIYEIDSKSPKRNITQAMRNYSQADNKKIVELSIGDLEDRLPRGARQLLIKFPSQYKCVN